MGVMLLSKVPGLFNLESAAELISKGTKEPLKYVRGHVFSAGSHGKIRLYDRFGKSMPWRIGVYEPSDGKDGEDIKASPYFFVDLDELMAALELHPNVQSMVKAELAPAGAAKPTPSPKRETKEDRQARRYQLCIDAGLPISDNDYASLLRGIGAIAKTEKITRQAFAEDVKAHINRLHSK